MMVMELGGTRSTASTILHGDVGGDEKNHSSYKNEKRQSSQDGPIYYTIGYSHSRSFLFHPYDMVTWQKAYFFPKSSDILLFFKSINHFFLFIF
jgi:hypothetical protein